jgi:hypothetical protein
MRREGRHCARWDDFAAFLADLGERPAGTRLATAGSYAPGHCRWEKVEPRAVRAARGWDKRRLAGPQSPVERAPTSHARSSPPAAAIIRASTPR